MPPITSTPANMIPFARRSLFNAAQIALSLSFKKEATAVPPWSKLFNSRPFLCTRKIAPRGCPFNSKILLSPSWASSRYSWTIIQCRSLLVATRICSLKAGSLTVANMIPIPPCPSIGLIVIRGNFFAKSSMLWISRATNVRGIQSWYLNELSFSFQSRIADGLFMTRTVEGKRSSNKVT